MNSPIAMLIHGEHRHMVQYRALAHENGMPIDRMVLADIGDVIEVSRGRVVVTFDEGGDLDPIMRQS